MENILLTTLSTLGRNHSVSYYYDEKSGKFFTGISTNEPGTKSLLSSDVAFTKILVLGSRATFEASDILQIDNLYASLKQLNQLIRNKKENNEKPSALLFYQYRISQYQNNRHYEEDEILQSVEKLRKKELQEIVSSVLKAKGYEDSGMWFENIYESGSELKKAIQSAIREDIEKNFVKPEDYDKYRNPEQFPELLDVKEEQSTIHDVEKQLDQIARRLKNSKTSSPIAQEALVADGLDRVESWRAQLESRKLKGTEAQYKEVLNRLSETIRSLINEVQSLRTKREQNENSYAQYWLYSLMKPDQQLSCTAINGKVSLSFIPTEDAEGNYDLNGIINGIRNASVSQMNLYIDMQGGSRTDAYFLNSLLTVLNNESGNSINVAARIASNYEFTRFASPVVDETKRYQISDLVSGMDAFLTYGRAGLIQKYVNDTGIQDKRVIAMADAMTGIDHALSICDIDSLAASIQKLKAVLNDKTASSSDDIFHILEDGIRRDYEKYGILNETMDYGDLARWALEKNFTQQALTIIEARMPVEIIRHGIRYYSVNGNHSRNAMAAALKTIRNLYERNGNLRRDLYRLNDPSHYLIKDYSYQKDIIQQAAGVILQDNIDQAYAKGEADAFLQSYSMLASLRNQLNHAGIDEESFALAAGADPQERQQKDWILNVLQDRMRKFLNEYISLRNKSAAEYPVVEREDLL